MKVPQSMTNQSVKNKSRFLLQDGILIDKQLQDDEISRGDDSHESQHRIKGRGSAFQNPPYQH